MVILTDNTKKISVRVRHIHKIRKQCILSTIQMIETKLNDLEEPIRKKQKHELEEVNDKSRCTEIRDLEKVFDILQSWVNFATIDKVNVIGINHDNISVTAPTIMVQLKLVGLMHFVNHSDEAGAWSHGQCMDIVEFFDQLIEFESHHKTKTILKDLTQMNKIRDLFHYAALNDGYVLCCRCNLGL